MRPDNPRFPHCCKITRASDPGPMDDETAGIVVYEGACRAYDKHTTSDKGEVITSYRGLALPITRDGWKCRCYTPRSGDEIVVRRGKYEEYGRVIDLNPSNFGGTHLVWRYGRNG